MKKEPHWKIYVYVFSIIYLLIRILFPIIENKYITIIDFLLCSFIVFDILMTMDIITSNRTNRKEVNEDVKRN